MQRLTRAVDRSEVPPRKLKEQNTRTEDAVIYACARLYDRRWIGIPSDWIF